MMFPTLSRRRGVAFRLFVSFTTALAVAAAPLQADVLIWDANTTLDNAQDGAGTWTNTGGNWFNFTQTLQNHPWVDGSEGVFGAGTGAAGTITLSGPITAAGLTFAPAGSGSYTLGGSGTLTLTNATVTTNASGTISAVLAGGTPWTKTGAATLTLSGATTNTHTGTLALSQGTLALAKTGGATALAGNLNISNGAFVTFSGSTTNQIAATSAVTMTGEASVFNGTGPNAGTGNSLNQTLASLTIAGGTFNAGAISTWNITGALSMTGGAAGSRSVFVGNSSAVINAGSLSLVDMNGANSATEVTNGFTLFGNGGVNGTTRMTVGSGGLYLQNSIIHLSAGSTGSLMYLNGDVSTGGTAASFIQLAPATTGTQPALGLGTTGTVSRGFNVASGADLTVNVAVTNGTATSAALVKSGTGTLILSGATANTYSGDTTINAGTLRLNKTAGVIAVAGNIIVSTGGTLQLSASHQIDDTKGITLNGGALTSFSTDETIAFFTQNSGGLASSGNTGHMTITGALTLAGGTILTINSNTSANPPSWAANSVVMTGADILMGGNNNTGNPRTSLTIGPGGLTMAGRTITMNAGTAGTVINLNGDFTGSGSNTLVNGGGGTVQPLLAIGSGTRRFNLLNGTTTIGVEISGTGGSLVKTGPGLLQLTAGNSYTGTTTVSGGTLSVSGTGGFLNGTSGVVVNGGGTLQNGSSTVANNNGVNNRINTAATLTLGGGLYTQATAAAGSTTTQSLASLMVAGGANSVTVSTLATSTNTLTFTGANPYTRTGGVVNFVQTPASGSSIVFTNAPSGAGNVSGGALVGAVLNGADLVAAQSGVVTAFSGWVPTGTSTWTTGAAMDVTGTNAAAYAGTNITALRFNTVGPFTVTLTGTHTIDTSVILMSAAAGAGNSLVTGGTLQGAAGGLVLAQHNTTGSLEIASTIADNATASDLVKSGGGLVILSGTNSYTGVTRVGEGVLRAADGAGLPTGSALELSGGVFESSAASFTRTLGTGAGQVSLGGASAGFSAGAAALTVNLGGAGATVQWGSANFNPSALVLNAATATATLDLVNGLDLNGFSRTIRVDATAANTATVSGFISNSVSGSPAALIKTGTGTLRLTQANTYDGGTVINGGLIAVAHNQALGAGTVTLSGGGLQADGAARTLTNNVVIAGAGTVAGSQNLTLTGTFTNSGGNQSLNTTLTGGAVLELAGNVYLSESATTSRVMQIFGGGDRVISGIIANNAGDNALASNLFFNGSGTLALTGLNTYTGRTLSAGGGYIVLSQDRNLGATPAASMVDALILSNNGRIRAAASFTLNANRGIGIGNSSGGAATGQIDVVTNVTLTVAGTIADRTLNQDGTAVSAANTGALTKTGAGALLLSGSNSYSGLTTVSNGVLQLGSNGALGSTAGGTTVSGTGHLLLADGVKITGETLTLANSAGSVNGTAQLGAPEAGRGTLMAGLNAKAEWAGNIVLGTDLSRIGAQEGGTLTISGNITDGANSFTLRIAGELTKTGGVILSGTGNAWDGATEVIRGRLILGAHNTLPTTTALDIHFASTNNAEYAGVEMNGFNQTIGILRNTGSTGANAELTNSSRTLSTLTLNDTGTNTYGGIITGNVALVKNGGGTLILTQTNRLTGGITVNNGLLRVSTAGALAEGNVAINGGASNAGKLDVNNVNVGINALNGSAGAVAGVIANESATNATRTLSLGVNHGSGSYAGQIVDNSGGAAQGKIAVAKIGAGTQTLSGTGTYTGGTLVSNGTLVADYATGTPLGSSTISLQGGTLAIRNATGATIGNVTLVQGGADFTAGNVLRVEGTGSVTATQLTVNSFAPLLVDLSSGSSFAATLSGVAMSNGILIGTGSNRANVLVKDSGGVGFAVHNGTTGQITRYTGATALPSGSASTSTSTNYVVNADLSRTASLNFQTLQIDTSAGNVALNLGSSNITVGNGRVVLVTGTNNASINSTGAVTSGSIFFANHSTGALTVGISLSGQALVNMGPGLVDYTNSGILGDVYAAGGVLRISGADRDFSSAASVVRIYGGGVLEMAADINGTGTAGAFTRAVGQGGGQVALLGNGGFSAVGADRVVALGGVGTATALTWGAGNFLVGASTTTDANYTFMLGSATSTHTVEFQNAIALGSRERRIEVADGTSSTNTDARLSGVLSGTGSVVKEGAGRLEFSAVNTYSGATQVNAGSLVVAAPGRTGTGAVSVAANAALMGTGVVQGSAFTLAGSAALHAGNDTTTASLGTLAFQTTAKAVFDLQAGSLTTLDVLTATNAAAVDASFGGNAIGSAGYNAFVDAFNSTGTGAHDLLTFDGAAGSTLIFSSNLSVRGDSLASSAAMGQVFNLVDWSSLVSADFTGFNVGTNFRTGAEDNGLQFDLPELGAGLFWDVSRFTTSGVIVVVPEPSRALLMLLGLLALTWRRRRN